LPREVTATILTLFGLAAAVLLAHLMRRAWSRRAPDEAEPEGRLLANPVSPWVRVVRQVLGLLYFVLLAYLLSRGGISIDAIMALGAGAGAIGPGAGADAAAASAPPLVTWSFGILALAAALGALALAVWVSLGSGLIRREDGGGPAMPAAIESAVEDSVEDLRGEPDARRAIIRCYARFERAAADSGVPRTPWSTPMEFMREALRRLPVSRTAVPTLTGLFELARFSHHPLGPSERDRALEALEEIKTAIGATESDAAAR
jgi:hypothetical protein